MGGVEHAVMHLLYSRFFTKALADLGLIDARSRSWRLFTQGMIIRDGAKMSKSQGQRGQPGRLRRALGADTFARYLMFLGPCDQDRDWSDEGVGACTASWTACGAWARVAPTPASSRCWGRGAAPGRRPEPMRKAHATIAKVTDDMAGRFAFNTAFSAVMELVNEAYRRRTTVEPGVAASPTATAVSLILPFAPHTGRRGLWPLTASASGRRPGRWPTKSLLELDMIEIVVQVNGKVRDRLQAPPNASREELAAARAPPKAQAHFDGKKLVKVLVVPGKLVNFVVR